MAVSDFSTSARDDGPASVRRAITIYLGVLITILLSLWVTFFSDIARNIADVWFFLPIGVFGAIIANSTGAGGGVVFVPAFNALSGASEMGAIPMEIQIDPMSTVGISFLIQCFGMSVGSCVWIYRFFGGGSVPASDRVSAQTFRIIVFTTLVTTIPALLVTQVAFFANADGDLVIDAFKWFSLILGIVLLVFAWALKDVRAERNRIEHSDIYWLLFLGLVGGVITAFFSVGVGELVAVYLILRKFPVIASVAAAVVISAITVISGVGYHIMEGNIVWPIALLAIPGAMVGGFLARSFAVWLGPLWLKTFASIWIIVSSAFLIWGSSIGAMPA